MGDNRAGAYRCVSITGSSFAEFASAPRTVAHLDHPQLAPVDWPLAAAQRVDGLGAGTALPLGWGLCAGLAGTGSGGGFVTVVSSAGVRRCAAVAGVVWRFAAALRTRRGAGID